MEVIMIAAMAKNRVIGNNNSIPWHLKEDFQHFKSHTIGHPIIMGKKTFNSLKKELPDREHIILTRFPVHGHTCFDSLKDALDYCKIKNNSKAFLIGGSGVYKEGLDIADTILLTQIEKDFKGDVSFPEIDVSKWHITEKENAYSDENDFSYSFKTYRKK